MRWRWVVCWLLLCPSVWAYRTEKPPVLTMPVESDDVALLNKAMGDFWDLTNGRYTLDVELSNPNGSRLGDRGDMVNAFYGGANYLCVNTSTPARGKTWTCLNITSPAGGGCPGGSDTQVLFNDAGSCNGNAALTFNKATGLTTHTIATDGDSQVLQLTNSQPHAGSSTNESTTIRFGLSTDADAARIRAGKINDFTSAGAKDSFLRFYTEEDGSAAEQLVMGGGNASGQVGINMAGAYPTNALEVNGSVVIGSGYVSSFTNPASDGLTVQGKVGIGTSSTTIPSQILLHIKSTAGAQPAALGLQGADGASVPSAIQFGTSTTQSLTAINLEQSNLIDGLPSVPNTLRLGWAGSEGYVWITNDDVTQVSEEDPNVIISGSSSLSQSITLASGITVPTERYVSIYAPTMKGIAGGSAETVTNASTVYIDSAPRYGSAINMSNAYALNVASGIVVVGDHIHSTGTTPAISSCGGGSPSDVGTDMVGKITMGTGIVTSCTLTFTTVWKNAPSCIANDETNIVLVRTATTTSTMTLSTAGSVAGETISYLCLGRE